MKQKVLLVVFFFLLTGAISSAQVKLDRKSKIFSAQSGHFINDPQFAVNTQTGDTLIVWFDSPRSDGTNPLVGRIINGKGQAVGKAFTIVPKPKDPQDGFAGLAVAYNPITNEFLLAYAEGHAEETRDVAKTFVLRLTSHGRPQGKAIDITSNNPLTAPYDNTPIAITFHPKTGGYLLNIGTHGDFHVAGDSFYSYALLTGKGTLSAPLQTPYNGIPGPLVGYGQLIMGFAFLPSAGKLLIAGHEVRTNTPTLDYFDYALATVDPTKLNQKYVFVKIRRVLNPDNPPRNRFGFNFAAMDLAFPSADSAVVFFTDNENLRGRKINASGKISGPNFNAFKSPKNNTQLLFPSAAFSTTSGGVRGILIAVEDEGIDGRSAIWAQTLDKNGKPSGSPGKLYTTAVTERIGVGGTFVVALPVQPGDTVSRFLWFGIVQQGKDFDPRISYGNIGNLLLKLDISLRIP